MSDSFVFEIPIKTTPQEERVLSVRFDKVIWNSLELELLYDPVDKDGVQAHALSRKTKYVRIVRRKIKGENRFFAQLVQEGKPLIKEKHILSN